MQRIVTKTPLMSKSRVRPHRARMSAEDFGPHVDVQPTLGAGGLPPGLQYTSFRGDPWLQENAPTRQKHASSADLQMPRLIEVCTWLLTRSDCHSLQVGFSTSQVRTESILRPFSHEIHDVAALSADDYLDRHFVEVPFDAKIDAIDWTQRRISEGPIGRFRQGDHKSALDRPQPRSWRLGSVAEICNVVRDLARLREAPHHYLCSAAVSLGQGIVCASFSCDATYVVPLRHFRDFVAHNFAAPG